MTGDQIKKLRERLGLTHKEFAELFGVALSTVYRWEYVERPNVEPCHARVINALKLFGGPRNMKRLRELLGANDGLSALLFVLHSLADNDWIVRRPANGGTQ